MSKQEGPALGAAVGPDLGTVRPRPHGLTRLSTPPIDELGNSGSLDTHIPVAAILGTLAFYLEG